jgi:hypothetical protein
MGRGLPPQARGGKAQCGRGKKATPADCIHSNLLTIESVSDPV